MNDAFTRQVQDFTRQAQEMFTAGKDAKVPENISAFAEDAIAKSRDAYHKFTALAKDNAKVAEEVLLTTQAGAKSIGEKIVANTLANTEAAFEAAQAIARARTFPEIARLQANYWQQQIAAGEIHRASGDIRRGRGQEAQDRPAQHGLAAARFSDDAQSLASADRERDVVVRQNGPPRGAEADGQILDGEQSFGHGVQTVV